MITEILGSLAATRLEKHEVTAPANSGDTLLLSLSVPAGKKALVCVVGSSPSMPSVTYAPNITIGEVEAAPGLRYGEYGASRFVTGDIEVLFRPRAGSGINNATFTGAVYVLEMEDDTP